MATDITVASSLDLVAPARRGWLAETWRQLRRNRAAVIGGVIVAAYILTAILMWIPAAAQVLAPYGYNEGDSSNRLLAPYLFFWTSAESIDQELTLAQQTLALRQVAEQIRQGEIASITIAQDRQRLAVRLKNGDVIASQKDPGVGMQKALRDVGVSTREVVPIRIKPSEPTRDRRFALGTDALGRDIFTRVMYGTRISLEIQILTVALALVLGVVLGLVAGYYGRWLDEIVMRSMDILLAFPSLILAMAFVAAFRARFDPLISLIVAVGVTSTPVFARITRGSVLSVKEKEYVEAARAIGESNVNIIGRYVLPNVMAPIIVQTTLRMATVLLTAAGLGFLGLGPDPSIPEWGNMINQNRTYLIAAPHTVLIPGLAIMIVVLGFNLFGDGLRDALDPRLRM